MPTDIQSMECRLRLSGEPESMAGMHDDARPSFQETQEQVNLTSVKLLLTDAALSLTFISVAETTGLPETAKRNVHNAHKAYDSIQHFRLKHVLTDTETETLDARLREMKTRLEALGEAF